MEMIFLFTGLVIGAGAAWIILSSRLKNDVQTASAILLAEKERNKVILEQLQELKRETDEERRKNLAVSNELASSEADYRNLQEKLQDQHKEFENLTEKFSMQFKNLANDIFEEKSKKFTDQNKANLFDLLKPLGEKI
ncbi:MAG TPA: hypothetical protein VK666_30040, partial [Chryseolinea sp.]|nr:hypothetical protein [Chryseolinea sp.]